ncbi:MAG: NUDIX domain-containing protein, partial [Clostridia bacterium]|nr:NUDIX domain-containing protein [Clostridia bacterium]
MEYIDIFDENNNPIGKIKEKQQAHEDGNFHRTAHVWIINDKNELLLQKRSASKKSHPNCWDISGAGHIRAGESVTEGAIRELKEELGVETTEKDLNYIATIKSTKNPKNMEFGYVYLLRCNKKIEDYIFEDDEVSEVKYVYFEDLEKMIEEKVEGLLLHDEEFKKLFEYIRNKEKDKYYIDIAIEISKNAKYPYGAIVVKDGEIIGRSDDKTLMETSMYSHAELEAIESASKNKNLYGDLKGATMYVSCEPCMMCMGAILYEEFSKIVYAATLQDSNNYYCPEMITNIDELAKYG